MKAVGFKKSLPITEPDSFIDFSMEKPIPKGHDILVKIGATSINPVDFKIRKIALKDTESELPKVIGWDAVGVVEAKGEQVSLFNVGDKVFYAGDINRSGSNAEYQLVDERIVGKKPQKLSDAAAAAIPLTGLTVWELIFDRMRIDSNKDKGKSILILGGAGGVGSMAIQIAKKIIGLQVIATASRPETVAWCKAQGADIVVNHKDLVNEMTKMGFPQVDFILDFVDMNIYWNHVVKLIKPQGRIGSITGTQHPVSLDELKDKSVSFSWELMYTRSIYQTEDMIEQHHILNTLADLLDNGTLTSTLHKTINGLSANSFKEAHALLESGKSIGKVVVTF